jgi:hypothetical protein
MVVPEAAGPPPGRPAARPVRRPACPPSGLPGEPAPGAGPLLVTPSATTAV